MPNVYRPNAYFFSLEPDVIFGKLSIYGTWPLCTEIFLLNDIQRVEWEKSSYITSQSRSHSGAESFCWNSIPRPAWLWHSDLELITSPASWPVHSETIRGFKFKILLYNLYYRQRANTSFLSGQTLPTLPAALYQTATWSVTWQCRSHSCSSVIIKKNQN